MNKMFSGCASLEYLDISNLDIDKLESYDEMFNGADLIKYIGLYNVKKSNLLINLISITSNLMNKENLTVCQNEDIINNENALYDCCSYWDYYFGKLRCVPDNYITIKFKNEVKYPYGFGFIIDQSQNEYRTEIYFVKYDNVRYGLSESLIIPKDKEVKIAFNSELTSATKFFYDYLDPNVEHIVSIDLSNFNSSLLESAESMFYGCTSLESIDLTNFNASLLTNIKNMFFHCDSLKIIDLSDFNSSSLTNINRLFCGCTSLEYLNLKGLDLAKIEDASYMFYNVKNLKFINLYEIKYNEILKNEINNISELQNENVVVSQSENLITNINYKYFDYDFDMNFFKCKNYIVVYYSQAIEYDSGFLISGIEGRNNIAFIINENNMYKTDEKLNINSQIKLCFKNNVLSLEQFFDSSIDTKPF